jgi:hypothetical protein
VNGCIECVGKGISGAYQLGEAGVDIVRELEAATTALSCRVRKAERPPEIVVAGEVEKAARDMLEGDKFRGFEVWKGASACDLALSRRERRYRKS